MLDRYGRLFVNFSPGVSGNALVENGFGVVYTPRFWRWIMLIIRHLPERTFIRTKL